MLPIGPLMIEHRLIERMIEVMKIELKQIEQNKRVEPEFIETAVDFIRTYADRCHHGKEEDILFRDLKKKQLHDEHKKIMNELEQEHKRGREIVSRLVEAKVKYVKGDKQALSAITDLMKSLVEFYPKHIEKEDKHFFMPVMKYFDEAEKTAMLNEEYEFDRTLIHEKYRNIIEKLEAA